jgi:polysaccharide export outer membrane protein
VQRSLKARMVNPQVIVNVSGNVNNSVTVIGEVRTAGRFPLSPNHERLLDVIAQAGGATKPSADVQVTIVRGEQSRSATLAALLANPAENIRLSPGDQIRLVIRPRKFSTFGAFSKASQVSIDDERISLAGAISRLGGLDANTADAGSVLVFRLERAAVAKSVGVQAPEGSAVAPIIYRFNMREPASYFVANTFEIRPDDLIYVPRSDAAEVKKFFELVTSISQVAYDVRVTSVLR